MPLTEEQQKLLDEAGSIQDQVATKEAESLLAEIDDIDPVGQLDEEEETPPSEEEAPDEEGSEEEDPEDAAEEETLPGEEDSLEDEPEGVTTPDGEEEEEEEPEGEKTPSAEEALVAQNKLLMQKVNELSGMDEFDVPEVSPADPPPAPAQPPAAPLPPVPPVTIEPQDFVGDADIDDIVADKDKFNKILNDAVAQGAEIGYQRALRTMPMIINSQVGMQIDLKQAVDQFYKHNPDLVDVKRAVGAAANAITAENPALTMDEVFKEAAGRTRKMLGINQPANKREGGKPVRQRKAKPPKRTRAARRVVGKQDKTLQSEIDEL